MIGELVPAKYAAALVGSKSAKIELANWQRPANDGAPIGRGRGHGIMSGRRIAEARRLGQPASKCCRPDCLAAVLFNRPPFRPAASQPAADWLLCERAPAAPAPNLNWPQRTLAGQPARAPPPLSLVLILILIRAQVPARRPTRRRQPECECARAEWAATTVGATGVCSAAPSLVAGASIGQV